ncbi:YqcC family protein [Vibrio sp. T187]|uniref:YqcC family protein n=1 Tax=Vibrio TaxID=662 RepID=UPI0010CA0C13|nr:MULTISPECIES: YqcC family protein [Vibrio]MBW3694345.1 YqcC family protein [Vibrio sp. T187]
MTAAAKLPQLLSLLEQHLQAEELWDQVPPSQEALASTQPFAIDTLQPEQWLQWIFIVKIQAMLELGQAMPQGFSIHPYFSEVWKGQPEKAVILDVIQSIDEACA